MEVLAKACYRVCCCFISPLKILLFLIANEYSNSDAVKNMALEFLGNDYQQ